MASKPEKKKGEAVEVTAEGGVEEHGEGFGDKEIGFWGSVCLLANNITGPGMVQIPVLFQQAGWLFPVIAFTYIGLLSGITSLFLAKAVSQIPGNRNLKLRIEFGNLARMLFPRWLYLLTFVALIFNFQVTNMSSIVVSAQVMDDTLLTAAGKTCALQFYPLPSPSEAFRCIANDGDVRAGGSNSPFGSPFVISLGYIITMAITIPLGYLNLDDNIWVQYGGFLLLLMCIIGWMVQFIGVSGLELARMPLAVGSGMGTVLPTVVFNWGFITTLPSWLNEKNPSVSVARATWTAIAVSGAMFFALGVLGAMALDYPGGEDLLSAMSDPAVPGITAFSKACAYIFPSAALLSGIPVFSIIIRYNLLENKVCNKFWANVFAVLFPWVVSLGFYPGTLLSILINWSSAILFVALNFVLPMMLYLGVNSDAGRAHIIKSMREQGLLTVPGQEEGAEFTVEANEGMGALERAALTSPSSASAAPAGGEGQPSGDAAPKKKTLGKKMMSFVRREARSTGELAGFDGSLAHDAAHETEHVHMVRARKDSNSTKKGGSGGSGKLGLSSLSAMGRSFRGLFAGEGTAADGANSDRVGLLSAVDEEGEDEDGGADVDLALDWAGADDIAELPSWWCMCCGWRTPSVTARVWLWSSAAIALACFALQIAATADPDSTGGGGS